MASLAKALLPDRIAIDGPASSGKSTLAQMIAKKLGYLYFDTGVMYRAVTYAALEKGVPIDNEPAVVKIAEQIRIDILPASKKDGRKFDVRIDGKDATWKIREKAVEEYVSPVSTYDGVRKAMTAQQRQIGLRGRVVMAGRDIGTVVLPDADLKIFLQASPEVRARRRYLENKKLGKKSDYEEILHAIQKRDTIDSSRKIAPLVPAEDAILINTDHLSIRRLVSQVMGFIQRTGDQENHLK
jgi:cytidylate kinase